MITLTFITTKIIKGKEYKYLRYSYQENNKKTIVELALGPEPVDIESIKEKLMIKVVNKRWIPTVERIRQEYQQHMSKFNEDSIDAYLENFGMRFTYDTNKIEGSTLNYQAVKGILFHDFSPTTKPLSDVDETRSHMAVFKSMLSSNDDLSLSLITKWHAELFAVSKPRIAGFIHYDPVSIGGSDYKPPATHAEVERGLKLLFIWYANNKGKMHPVLLSCIMSFRFVSIHPFGDGNGRVSRLIMNHVLYHAGYPMFNIEYIIRQGYYNALEAAQLKEDELHFVQWFFTRYIKASLKTSK